VPLTSEGVRKDVSDYIVATFPNDPKLKRATIQFAKAFQQVLNQESAFDVAGKAPRESALEIHKKLSKSGACLLGLVKNIDQVTLIGKELEKRTFNNSKRAKIYLKFNGALSGSVLHHPAANESLCD
jgi:hypothetical protein